MESYLLLVEAGSKSSEWESEREKDLRWLAFGDSFENDEKDELCILLSQQTAGFDLCAVSPLKPRCASNKAPAGLSGGV